MREGSGDSSALRSVSLTLNGWADLEALQDALGLYIPYCWGMAEALNEPNEPGHRWRDENDRCLDMLDQIHALMDVEDSDLGRDCLVPLPDVLPARATGVLPAALHEFEVGAAGSTGDVIAPPLVSGLLGHECSVPDLGPGSPLGAGTPHGMVEGREFGADPALPLGDGDEGRVERGAGSGDLVHEAPVDRLVGLEFGDRYVGGVVHASTIDDDRPNRQPEMTERPVRFDPRWNERRGWA